MKKLFSLLMLFAFFTSASMAQVPARSTTGSAPASTMQTSKSSAMMKKDGTPDKRYKANQMAKPAKAGPMKKDGTPDKRYKANKTATPKM